MATTLTYASGVVRAVPKVPLALADRYTVRITNGVRDAGGASLGGEFASSFMTRDGSWAAELQAESLAAAVNGPVFVGVVDSGEGQAVWQTLASISHMAFHPQSGWSSPREVATFASGVQQHQLQVALSKAGHAVATWTDWVQNSIEVRVRMYSPQSGWGNPARTVNALPNQGSAPHAGIADDATAIVAWVSGFVAASHYDPAGQNWSVQSIISDGAGTCLLPQVAVQPSGIMIVMWAQQSGATARIRSARFVPGQGWSAPVDIHSTTGTVRALKLSRSGQADALAVWQQETPAANELWTTVSSASAWATPIAIAATTDTLADLEVASSPSGVAHVLWTRAPSASAASIWGATFAPGQGWSPGGRVLPESMVGLQDLRLGIDAAGNATASWLHRPGIEWVVSPSRFRLGRGWLPAERLAVDPLFDLSGNALSVSSGGRAIAGWTRVVALPHIHARHFQ